MHEDESSVERLNDELYSRKGYMPPNGERTALSPTDEPDANEKWNSPDLDTLLAEEPIIRRTFMKKFFLFSIFVFVLAGSLAAYMYFGGGSFVSSKNVDIQVTGPAAIEAGQPLSLTVTVLNNNNADLASAKLIVQYPDGTRQADNSGQSLSIANADLGAMKSGSESVQTFRSILFGQKGDIKEIKFSLEYTIAGSSATFYKDKTNDITIGDTPVTLEIGRPDTLTSGAPFALSITVGANSQDVTKNVIVHAEYPYGFTLASADPSPTGDSNTWSLGDLAPGSKKTITLNGNITGVDADERTFRFYAGVADPSNPNTLKTPLVSTTETFALTRSSVDLSMSLNGQSDTSYVAPMGGSITANITFQNNAPEKLTNARLALRLTGSALDKLSIKPDSAGFYDSANNQVVWESANDTDLAELDPGASGEVSVTFSSLKNLPIGQNETIDLDAELSGTPGDNVSAAPVEASARQTVKIASTVNLSGKALYSRGPFTNTGPIPPKAEATTTYTVVFNLGNTQNDIASSTLTAKLGPNVTWINATTTSADNPTYDPASNTLTWNVGTLASGAGFSSAEREADFQVMFNPSIGQIGTIANLVSDINFSGTDSFTHLPVSATFPSITTHLSSDPAFVQGDDMVVSNRQ